MTRYRHLVTRAGFHGDCGDTVRALTAYGWVVEVRWDDTEFHCVLRTKGTGDIRHSARGIDLRLTLRDLALDMAAST